MSRLGDDELVRRLTAPEGDEPPPGLLERLKADIPAELPVAPRRDRPVVAPSWRSWLAAATTAAALGAGWLAVERWRGAPLPAEAPATGVARDEVSRGPRPASEAQEAEPPAPSGALPPQAAPRQQAVVEQQPAELPPAKPKTLPPPPPPALAAPRPESDRDLRVKDEAPAKVQEGVASGVVGGTPGGVAGGVEGRRAEPAPAAAAPELQREEAAEAKARRDTFAENAESPPLLDKEKERENSSRKLAARQRLAAGRRPSGAEVGSEGWLARFDPPAAPLAREGLRATTVPGLAPGTAWLRVEARAGGAGTLTVEPIPGQVDGVRPLAGGAARAMASGEVRTFWYQLRLSPQRQTGRPLARLELRLGERTLATQAEGLAGERFDKAPPAVRLAVLAAELSLAKAQGERGRLAEIVQKTASLAAELAGRPQGALAAELAQAAETAAGP